MSIIIENISKSYGERRVLYNYSRVVQDGEIFYLTGKSGSGKTTLLKILAGLVRPDSGRVQGLEGRRLSVVFQENRLLPWYSAKQNIDLLFRRPEKSAGLLEKLGLADSMSLLPSELSGGMRRRLALARALTPDFDVLLADEPFRELDEETRRTVMRVLAEEAYGKTMIIATHEEVRA